MTTKRKPVRNGVRASETFIDVANGRTALVALCNKFPQIPAEQWQRRFADKDILDQNGTPISPDFAINSGIHVYYFRSVATEDIVAAEEKIVFQDSHLLVADKPHFLPVAPTGEYVQETLLTRLIQKSGIETLSPLHRLDKDTAGLVLFSINPATRNAYQALFRRRNIQKTYEAIAPHLPHLSFPLCTENRLEDDPKHFMQMRVVKGEPNAKTHIEVIERIGDLTWYRLRPETGQRHQLRIQMAHLGAAILNDPIYPILQEKRAVLSPHAPLQLLAKSLEFLDPIAGVQRKFESALHLTI